MNDALSPPGMTLVSWTITTLLAGAALAQTTNTVEPRAAATQWRGLNYIVVTPNGPTDGGDFGPGTPGTKTSGLQEAFNRAHEEVRDVYIVGGGNNSMLQKGVSYRLDQTLRIPWMQDWRLDGGEYALTYTGEEGDAVVIDSQMNCRLKFGLIVMQRSDGAVVRLAPTTKGPDNFACCVASTFEFNGLVGAGDVWGKSSQQKSTGLLFDTAHSGISGNRVFILEVNACRIGAWLMQGAHNNLVEAQWIHLTNLGIQLGDANAPEVSGNRIIAGISGDIPHTTGVRVFGNRNSLRLDVLSADPERGLVLEEPAHDNLIFTTGLAGGFTNKAKRPTNRLIAPSAPETVATPAVPASGQEVANRNLGPVQVQILTSGKVLEWAQTDSKGQSCALRSGLTPGQTFILNPGDKVRFTYQEAPSWSWKGF
jgi:hypothetical protein